MKRPIPSKLCASRACLAHILDEALVYIAQALYSCSNRPSKSDRLRDPKSAAAERLYIAVYAATVTFVGKKARRPSQGRFTSCGRR